MINKTTLIGHLGNDPDSRTLENGTSVCRLSVATSENWKDRDGQWQSRTQWHTVLCWRDLAERAAKLHKGQLVFVEGRYQSSDYTDKEGIKRTRFDLQAETVRSLEKREQQHGATQQQEAPVHYEQNKPDLDSTKADDLPF